jgi:hypothetical protein
MRLRGRYEGIQSSERAVLLQVGGADAYLFFA